MPAFAAPLRLAARASGPSRGRRGRLGPRAVRALLIAGLLAAMLAGGYAWLRDSSAVRVREVFVTGVTSSQEAEVRRALRRAALGMTTLDVDEKQLRAAVAPYASVADLRVDPSYPASLSIEVVEHVPAALVVAGTSRVPVADGGLLLRGVRPEADLPVVRLDRLPPGDRLLERAPKAAVRILAGVPGPLRGRVKGIRSGPRGLQAELRDGPDLIFGSATRVRAKWLAASRVLAASSAQGALYVDVRVPEWTAAGGVGPVDAPDDEAVPATPTATPLAPQP
jgi:cell division protein FtsQ